MPDVRLHWTDNPEVLLGRRARWFPIQRVIAIDKRERRLKTRCSLAHELAHIVLGDTCGTEDGLYDDRREQRADEFAARLLLPDLDLLARTIVVTVNDGHAANELNVTLNLYRVRLDTLEPEERAVIDGYVVGAAGEWGA
ncbi:ImmA/IrrE family metallo-endopeptidase [Pimelobacter simplex]|uniref:ImmA/IrrE family metallo-endopeptidase n=2 Tax=Nocardioides simplex TaxID=2045 RepID=A0A7J5DTT6_NOCSI|nr:ImmA/IrrE family metallo-endopeptidase [Pimelobacter simplex]